MTAGRPTKYDPAMCELVVPYMEQGYSTTALAGHLGVSRQSIYEWMGIYPEFSDAVKQGQAAGVEWWESCLRNNALTGQGNATAAIFGLKNRGPDDWRDKQVIEGPGPNGEHVVTMGVPDDVRSALDAIAGKITGGSQPG